MLQGCVHGAIMEFPIKETPQLQCVCVSILLPVSSLQEHTHTHTHTRLVAHTQARYNKNKCQINVKTIKKKRCFFSLLFSTLQQLKACNGL